MEKLGVTLLIISLYCFPFVYFSMYKDFADGSIAGYALMLPATVFLAYSGKMTGNLKAIIIGNTISVVTSYFFISKMAGNEEWLGYFKPLSPMQLLVLVSLLHAIPQFMAITLAGKIKSEIFERKV